MENYVFGLKSPSDLPIALLLFFPCLSSQKMRYFALMKYFEYWYYNWVWSVGNNTGRGDESILAT